MSTSATKCKTGSKCCLSRTSTFLFSKPLHPRIVIVLNLEAVHGPLASNIGNPVNVDTVAGAAPGDEETRQPPPQAQQPPQRPKPTPPQPQRNFIPTGGVYDNQPIIPIKGLNPYQNRWTIKARVTTKSERRTYTNSRGPGALFNVDLLDATGGEIRCTFFNQACEKFMPIIEEGKVSVATLLVVARIGNTQSSSLKLLLIFLFFFFGNTRFTSFQEDKSSMPTKSFPTSRTITRSPWMQTQL